MAPLLHIAPARFFGTILVAAMPRKKATPESTNEEGLLIVRRDGHARDGGSEATLLSAKLRPAGFVGVRKPDSSATMRRHDPVKAERPFAPCGFSCMRERLIDCAQHWRDRAEEVRTQTEHMNDAEARMMMRGIAESYEKLARGAEERARKPED